MATTLTDNYGKITIVIGSDTYNVKKSDINSMYANAKKGKVDLRINSGYIDGNVLQLVISDIAASYGGVSGLKKTLMSWWKEPQLDYAESLAVAGDTVFDTSPRVQLRPGYKVFVDGVLTRFGFSRSGNVVTFTTAMSGNEIIIIKN